MELKYCLVVFCSISCDGCRGSGACCRCGGVLSDCYDGGWCRSFSIGGSGGDEQVVSSLCRVVSPWCLSQRIDTPSRSIRCRVQGHIPWRCDVRVCPNGSISFLDSCVEP